ncbi:hypothetical protein AH716_002309 [Salmonella enterica subsp. enterica]|nr:hypothetical protein [Salmonella enterica subsp. enterica serovar Gbadago]
MTEEITLNDILICVEQIEVIPIPSNDACVAINFHYGDEDHALPAADKIHSTLTLEQVRFLAASLQRVLDAAEVDPVWTKAVKH